VSQEFGSSCTNEEDVHTKQIKSAKEKEKNNLLTEANVKKQE
jgi:hypothetical protein